MLSFKPSGHANFWMTSQNNVEWVVNYWHPYAMLCKPLPTPSVENKVQSVPQNDKLDTIISRLSHNNQPIQINPATVSSRPIPSTPWFHKKKLPIFTSLSPFKLNYRGRGFFFVKTPSPPLTCQPLWLASGLQTLSGISISKSRFNKHRIKEQIFHFKTLLMAPKALAWRLLQLRQFSILIYM